MYKKQVPGITKGDTVPETTVQKAATLSVAPNESAPDPVITKGDTVPETTVQEAATLSVAPNESASAPVSTKGDTVPETTVHDVTTLSPVRYTHLTLPTKRIFEISDGDDSL